MDAEEWREQRARSPVLSPVRSPVRAPGAWILRAPSKLDQLKAWMRTEQVFSTSSVIAWGLAHHFNRANREKGQLRHDGLIRELTKEEKVLRCLDTKQGIYEWMGEAASV